MSVPSTRSALLILRLLACACIGALGLDAIALQAETSAFDLAGPSLRISVTQGGVTLPLSQVPNLSTGDRLRIAAELPKEQGARYRMVLVFLRGATHPPPKNWLIQAEPWKPKKASIDVVVPAGAEQALVLLVPDTGGAIDAVDAAVRGRPGAFVRASQELNQAMLDRARLEAFLDYMRQSDPARIAEVSPQLAQSLAVRPDPNCLLAQPGARAACLAQGTNAAVLADSQTNSIAQTLAGAPADIALQLSSTAQAGGGYYSPYIGVVRDLARILGAFQSAQLQFIPALSVQTGDTTRLLLNAVPSFRKPQSVLVTALPTVAQAMPPPLQGRTEAQLCASQPGLVLPVGGAPLVFATDYARQMALRVQTKDGQTIERAVSADAALGGYVLTNSSDAGATSTPVTEGTLHGRWGFQPFDGPKFRLVTPAVSAWQVGEDASLVVGREAPILLSGGTAACVAEVMVEAGTRRQQVTWTARDEGLLALKVPLTDAEPGPVMLLVRSHGVDEPQRIPMQAYAEVSRVAGFTLHAGDRNGMLIGTRLDQVASLDINGVTFLPGAFDRAGTTDRLTMTTDMAAVGALQAGQSRQARVTLSDGRKIALRVTVAPSRPVATLVSKSIERTGPSPAVRLTLDGPDLLPQNARLVFSLKAEGSTRFAAGDKVEVAARDAAVTAILPLRLQDTRIAIAELDPQSALGDSAHGPLQVRVVQDGVASEWQALATLVRLPALSAITCSTACVLSGTGLFLVRSVSAGTGPRSQIVVPDGFTGSKIEVPRPASGRLILTLRDAPQAAAALAVPN